MQVVFYHIKLYLKPYWFASLFSVIFYPSFASASVPVPDNVQTVFVNNTCLNCHAGNNPFGGLSLDDAMVSDNSLVDVVANCSNNNAKLVNPGDPSTSVLYLKLANQNPNCGGVMPPNGPMISGADLSIIFDWIVSIGPAAQFGLFAMDATTVTVQETDPSVTLTVNRQLGTTGQVTVDFEVATVGNDSAVSPTDFEQQSGTLTFADGVTSQDITVVLVDDDEFEGTEVFSVTLSNPVNGAVLGADIQTKISITDNEFDNQPGTFFFSKVAYSVTEDAGSMDVMIIRAFGAAGQVSVNVAASDSEAVSGADYEAFNATLIFEEGVKNQTFSINIVDDEIEETSKTFRLALSSPNGGAVLGFPQRVSVTINDNDAANSGGGDTGGGDPGDGTGGGDAGGDAGGGSDTGSGVVEEASFEAAGSIFYLLGLLGLIGFVRRK